MQFSVPGDSVFYKYPDVLRLPLIFYYGHTAAVFVNKLVIAGLLELEVGWLCIHIWESQPGHSHHAVGVTSD
jgi:hypothetical protein